MNYSNTRYLVSDPKMNNEQKAQNISAKTCLFEITIDISGYNTVLYQKVWTKPTILTQTDK